MTRKEPVYWIYALKADGEPVDEGFASTKRGAYRVLLRMERKHPRLEVHTAYWHGGREVTVEEPKRLKS